MKNLICTLFGHKHRQTVYRQPAYAELRHYAFDGIERHHLRVMGTCERCGEKFTLAYAHLPDEIIDLNMERGYVREGKPT